MDNRELKHIRSFVNATVPAFHVCSGKRPGGYFLQKEANPVREMVVDHVARVAHREIKSN